MSNSKRTIILLICLIIVIVGIGFFAFGYLFGHKFQKIETVTTTLYTSVDLDIDSARVLNAYSFIPAFDTNKIITNAYQDTYINKDKLDNTYLLAASYAYLYSKFDAYNVETVDSEKGIIKFSSDLMDEVTKTIYGEKLNNESFDIGYNANVTYSDGYYIYSKLDGSLEYSAIIRNIDKAYEDDENLYIEDSFLYYVFNNNENHLYTESNMVNEVTLNEDYLNMGISASNIIDLISENYKDCMKKYLHTFKKNDDGSVYWYSTEPLDKE